MELKEAIEILNSYDFDEIAEFANGEMQQAIDTVLQELENYKNTIEVIEDLGQMKIEKQIELAKQKWGE